MGCANTGMRWATALVLKLLDVAWDQWDHRISLTNDLQDSADAQRINCEVEAQLQMGPQLLQGAALCRFDSPNRVHTLSTHLKCFWLSSVRNDRQRQQASRERALQTFSQELAAIAWWLGRPRIPTLDELRTHASHPPPSRPSHQQERALMHEFLLQAHKCPPE